MKIRNSQYLAFTLLLGFLYAPLFIGAASAEGPINLTAVGTATYQDELTAAVRKKALEDAKLQILKKYMAQQPAAKKSVYSNLE